MSEMVAKITDRGVQHSEGHMVMTHRSGAEEECERELEEEEEEEQEVEKITPAAQPAAETDWTSYRAALTAHCIAHLSDKVTKVGLVQTTCWSKSFLLPGNGSAPITSESFCCIAGNHFHHKLSAPCAS
jgi:hypothetical protein